MVEKAYIVIYNGVRWKPVLVKVLGKTSENEYQIKYHCNHRVVKVSMPSNKVYSTVEVADHVAKNLNGDEEWTGWKLY